MLNEYENGYAVMSRDLSGISGEFTDIETCKKYCRNGVIAERVTKTRGFGIEISLFNYIQFGYMKQENFINIQFLWFWITFRKIKRHITGKIVYDSNEQI